AAAPARPGRGAAPPPVALPYVLGLVQEVQRAAGGEVGLALLAADQQLTAAGVEGPVQVGDEIKRPGGEDLIVAVAHGSGNLDGDGIAHDMLLSPRSDAM